MADSSKKVIIDIKANTKQATTEIKSLNKQISSLEKQQAKSTKTMKNSTAAVNKIGASFKQLSLHLTRLLVIYGSFKAVSDTIKTFADFEQAMTTLGAISGATSEELSLLNDKAMELGETTVFTATEVAMGMTEMAKAGLSAQEQLDGIEAVLNLSIVGMVDLSEASITATTTMNAFGLEAKDIPMIVDVMAGSINSSAQNLTQLSNALKKVSPVAKAQNITFQETVSVLGVLADAGIRAERGGTQLKIAIERIASNQEAGKFIKELGLDMYDTNKQLLPLTDRLGLLKVRLDELSPKDRDFYVAKIFGSEALATANIMLDNIKVIDLQTQFLNNTFGVADEQARKMMDTLLGSYKELMSALQSLQINIGKNLSPALRGVIDDATDFIRAIDKQAIEEFTNAIANLITFTVDFGKTIATVGGIFVKLGVSVTNFLGLNIDGEFALITLAVYKFRNAILGLVATNPALALLVGTLTIVAGKTVSAVKQLEDFDDGVDKFTTNNNKFNKTLEDIALNLDNMSSTDARKYIGELGDEYDTVVRAMTDIKARRDDLQDTEDNIWGFQLSENERQELESLNVQYSSYERRLISIMDTKVKLQEIGQQALDVENDKRTENNKLTSEAKVLAGEELKLAEKMLANSKERVSDTEKTLKTLTDKESKYYSDLHKLEDDLAKTRQDYANKRATLNINFENDIANIRASDLSDIQQYNDAQLRADIALSNAKKSLLDGNLVLAKEYMSVYNSLITEQTNSEIKEGKRVLITKQQLNAELIRDKTDGHNVELAMLKVEETRAIALINSKMDMKKNEIALNKVQIDLQLKLLEIQTKSVNTLSKNITWDEDFKRAKLEVEELNAEADRLVEKDRQLQIDAVLNKAKFDKDVADVEKQTTINPNVEVDKNEIDNAVEEVEKPKIVMTITDLETGEVETKINGIRQEVEEPMTSELQVDTTASEQKMVQVRSKNQEPTTNIHTTLPNSSIVDRTISRLKLPTSSTHTIYVKTVEQHAEGGFIRREGALGGYGGGDKIQSLLEAGEFVVRKEAVSKLGLDKLYQINQGNIPKFQTGGVVGDTNTTTSNGTVNLNLNLGGKTYTTIADEDVAISLAKHLQRTEY